jgi:hypothetical protein
MAAETRELGWQGQQTKRHRARTANGQNGATPGGKGRKGADALDMPRGFAWKRSPDLAPSNAIIADLIELLATIDQKPARRIVHVGRKTINLLTHPRSNGNTRSRRHKAAARSRAGALTAQYARITVTRQKILVYKRCRFSVG